MRQRSATQALAASPVMVGAVTVLIAILAVFLAYNANNGLPFVPTYRISAQVKDAELAPAGQRGPDRRRPRGVVERGHTAAEREGRVSGQARPRARRRGRTAPGRLHDPRPRPLGIGAQVPGDQPRQLRRRARARRRPCRCPPRRPSRWTSTRCSIRSTIPLASRSRPTWSSSATRWPVVGPQLNAAIGELRSLLPPLDRVMTNLADPETQLGPLLRRPSRRPPPRSPRSRPSRRTCSPRSTRPSPRWRTSRARSSRRRSRRARPRSTSPPHAAAPAPVPRPQRRAVRRPRARHRGPACERRPRSPRRWRWERRSWRTRPS